MTKPLTFLLMNFVTLFLLAPVPVHADISITLSRCPWGATLKGSGPPDGLKEYCERENRSGVPEKHGVLRQWYVTGELELVGKYWYGVPVDSWVFWHKNKRMRAQVTYRLGKKEGAVTTWYDDGNGASQMEFRDNLPFGEWTSFYPNGEKKLVVLHTSPSTKTLDAWDEGANKRLTVEFKNGKAHGDARLWYSSGISLAHGKMENGVPRGNWKVWGENGKESETCSFFQATQTLMRNPRCALILDYLDSYVVEFEVPAVPF